MTQTLEQLLQKYSEYILYISDKERTVILDFLKEPRDILESRKKDIEPKDIHKYRYWEVHYAEGGFGKPFINEIFSTGTNWPEYRNEMSILNKLIIELTKNTVKILNFNEVQKAKKILIRHDSRINNEQKSAKKKAHAKQVKLEQTEQRIVATLENLESLNATHELENIEYDTILEAKSLILAYQETLRGEI